MSEEEKLRRLSPGEPHPRCPKCGNEGLTLDYDHVNGFNIMCHANKTHYWDGLDLADFAQFFSAPGEPPRLCEKCNETIGPLCQHIVWYEENGKEHRRHVIDCTAPITNECSGPPEIEFSQGGLSGAHSLVMPSPNADSRREEIAREIANAMIGPLLHAANGPKKISTNFLDEAAIEIAAILGKHEAGAAHCPEVITSRWTDENEAGVAPESKVETTNRAQKGEKFRIVKVNMNCFKMYLFGHFIGSASSEHTAHLREKNIADKINRYIHDEVKLRAAQRKTRFEEFDDAAHPANVWWEKHGQYMLSGGGRREFIWACRGWIAHEQFAESIEVTGEVHEPFPPSVSAQGAAPSVHEEIENMRDTMKGISVTEQQLTELRGAAHPPASAQWAEAIEDVDSMLVNLEVFAANGDHERRKRWHKEIIARLQAPLAAPPQPKATEKRGSE